MFRRFSLRRKSRGLPHDACDSSHRFFTSTKVDVKDHELLFRYYKTSLLTALKHNDTLYVPNDLLCLMAEFCGGKPSSFLQQHHRTRSFDDFFVQYVKYYNSPRCYMSPVYGHTATLRRERLSEIGLQPVSNPPKNLTRSARMEVFFGFLDELYDIFVTLKADISGKTELRVICADEQSAILGLESVVYRLDEIGVGVMVRC